MKCPTAKGDGDLNFGSFYCHKGYYAVNVQAIADRNKKILWYCVKCHGSKHDSAAFKSSSLCQILIEKPSFLIENGLCFLGNSACALRPFLITPYENAKHGCFEDDSNYHLFTNRIFIECAFGEVDSRWGIFWSPLRFKLQQNLKVIDAAMQLHNFIICHEMEVGNRGIDFKCIDFDDDVLKFMAANPNEITGIFIDEANNEIKTRGGSDNKQVRDLKRQGKMIRDGIKSKLASMGMRRPNLNWFRSESGRVKMS